MVSVPFRGYVVVILLLPYRDERGRMIVSVPFRGHVVVIDMKGKMKKRVAKKFPSPFGVM